MTFSGLVEVLIAVGVCVGWIWLEGIGRGNI
jgi:hypothetical protein